MFILCKPGDSYYGSLFELLMVTKVEQLLAYFSPRNAGIFSFRLSKGSKARHRMALNEWKINIQLRPTQSDTV